jgi:hypothetical protein
MAQGMLTATSGTDSGFLLVNLFILREFWAINELDCEHVSSQLVALGLHTAAVGTGSGFFHVKYFVFHLNSELSMSLIVSLWAHSSWPWACLQPQSVPAVVFSLLNFIFPSEFWATNELDCEHVSSQLMALSLLTTTAGTGSGFLLVNYLFFTWMLSCQSACVWACMYTVQGPRLAHSHCRYRQLFFACKIIFCNWTLSNLRTWLWACELTAPGPWPAYSPCWYRQCIFWH